jgi:fluoroquinolone transport system permease protein
MKRLVATVKTEFQLQFRNGFYYAAAFVAVLMVIGLLQIPAQSRSLLLPVMMLQNLMINTFYFTGGLVLLEKGQGTLEAQVVTPLRTWEYLAAKVITLGVLSLLESMVIVVLGYGFGFDVLPMAAGIMLMAACLTLFGFVVVARYDSINEYLLPSVLYLFVFSIPIVDYFDVMESWLFYLHPLQGPLLLLKSAFLPVQPWQIGYGVLSAGIWVSLIYLWSKRSFYRFIVRKEGVR